MDASNRKLQGASALVYNFTKSLGVPSGAPLSRGQQTKDYEQRTGDE